MNVHNEVKFAVNAIVHVCLPAISFHTLSRLLSVKNNPFMGFVYCK